MKIKVNYDLIRKIEEAKTGFSLQKNIKKILTYTCMSTMIFIPSNIMQSKPEYIIKDFFWFLSFHSFYRLFGLAFKNINKTIAIEDLKKLAIDLKRLNINTDYQSLLKSYSYKTEYKIKFNESLVPKLKQNKYIMIPDYSCGQEKEISMVQEHIVGTNKYTLSYGSPKKVLKLSYNPA